MTHLDVGTSAQRDINGNFLSGPSFPDKTACEYKGSTEEKEKFLIRNLNKYTIALQYSKLNQHTHPIG